MFTNRIPLFTLFDIKVGLDYSWFFLAILLVWSLMAGYFPWVAARPRHGELSVDGHPRGCGAVRLDHLP
jgi:hypothetical protein